MICNFNLGLASVLFVALAFAFFLGNYIGFRLGRKDMREEMEESETE